VTVEAQAPIGTKTQGELSPATQSWVVVTTSPDALFHAHYVRLVEAIAAATGDDDGAADAVQEAFVELWKHWDHVRLYEDPAGWVRRVAINRVFNRRRSLARYAAALLRLAEDRRTISASGEGSDSAVLSAFQTLPARQRLAMGLHYVGDLSVTEIAQAMGVSEGSVKQHLHRGREAMRHKLEVGNPEVE
jgi:RNA polymerase sigma-70 factor, ECF subfamily